MTGPVISATWNTIVHRATSHGSWAGGTVSAGSDRDAGATNARAMPSASASPNRGATAVGEVAT